MQDFWSATNPVDPAYIAVRDKGEFSAVRTRMEVLWSQYYPYADHHFVQEIGQQFQQRYWEMRLGCTLLDLGFDLTPGNSQGPDFDVTSADGARTYIEAVAVTAGKGADAVPAPNYNQNETQVYPTCEILVRIRRAIEDKCEQHESYINKGVIERSIPYVIAINIGGITPGRIKDSPPTIAQVCFGVGGLMVGFNPDGTHDVALSRQETIRKRSGADIATDLFLTDNYFWLSGILISDVNPFRLSSIPHKFQFAHNRKAKHPLPHGWFPIGSEHWFEDNRICNHWH